MIKKYNQFVDDKVNEEFNFGAAPAPAPSPNTSPSPTTRPSTPSKPEPRPNAPSPIPGKRVSPIPAPAKAFIEADMEEEAEEVGDVYRNKLKELADALGVELTNDKTVIYNSKKIYYPSETDKYHVEGVKKPFNTLDEVVSFLKSDGSNTEIEQDDYKYEDDLFIEDEFESKSYKKLRKFKK